MTTMRSARRAASRTLCVTNSTVRPRWATRAASSSWRTSRVIASRAPNGSSISSRSASWAKARASAARWRMPPDSWWGRLRANPSRCTVESSAADRSLRSDLGTPARRIGSSTLASIVNHGKSADSWNISAGRLCTSTTPAVGLSSPATRLRIVDLPQPEAPMMHTNSPVATSRSTSRSSGDRVGAGPEDLVDTAQREDAHDPAAARSEASSTEASPRSSSTSLSNVRS